MQVNHYFGKIGMEKGRNVNRIIEYIQQGINNRTLLPGDRLPAERKLAEQFGISRQQVRMAFQKLELYGIVKTYPQSGTVVSSFNNRQLEMLLENALSISQYDFHSLVSVRILLEAEALRLCAENHNEHDLKLIEEALTRADSDFGTKKHVESDFKFHIAISAAAHNPVIHSLLMTIIPDTLRYYNKFKICEVPKEIVRLQHHEMLELIYSGNGAEARQLIENHLRAQLEMQAV